MWGVCDKADFRKQPARCSRWLGTNPSKCAHHRQNGGPAALKAADRKGARGGVPHRGRSAAQGGGQGRRVLALAR